MQKVINSQELDQNNSYTFVYLSKGLKYVGQDELSSWPKLVSNYMSLRVAKPVHQYA